MASNAGAVRAGRAYVELYGDDSKLARVLKGAEKKLKSWGASISSLGAKVMAGGAAILGPMLLAAKSFASAGDTLDKMSGRTGVAVEFLSALGHAADLGGSNLETMEKAIRRLQRTAYDAGQGLSTAVDAFDALGISATDADGTLKGTEQLFMESVAALSELTNETQKAALAQVLFGRAGTQLLPMLNNGAAGLQAAMEEAKRLGLVMSTEDATAAAALTDAWTKLSSSATRTASVFASALAPALASVMDALTETLQPVMDFVSANGDLVVNTATVAAGMLAAGAAVKVFGMAMTFVAAHPVGAVLLAIATAATILTTALSGTAKSTRECLRETAALLQKQQEHRAEMERHLGRLNELQSKERLNNEEMSEADRLIRALEGRYGSLGLKLNETTGQIEGMTRAWERARAAQDRMEIRKIDQEIDKLRKQLRELSPETRTGFSFSFGGLSQSMIQGMRAAQKEAHDLNEKVAELQLRRRALAEGMPMPGETSPGGPSGAAPTDEAEKRLRDSLTYAAELYHRQQEIRISMMEDANAREIEGINEKFDHEIKLAKLAGKTIAGIEETRRLELQAAQKRQNAELAAEKKRAAQEVAEREKELQFEIERLQIERSMKGAARERALLDLEEKRAIAEARAAGIDPSLVRKKFSLMGSVVSGADRSSSVAGTFNAMAVGRLGFGGGPAERTARATEGTFQLLRRKFQFTGPTTSSVFGP